MRSREWGDVTIMMGMLEGSCLWTWRYQCELYTFKAHITHAKTLLEP